MTDTQPDLSGIGRTGMAKKRCPRTWHDKCARTRNIFGEHVCARPPGHPDGCMCYCSARPAADGQEVLFAAPPRLRAAGLAAARRRAAGVSRP